MGVPIFTIASCPRNQMQRDSHFRFPSLPFSSTASHFPYESSAQLLWKGKQSNFWPLPFLQGSSGSPVAERSRGFPTKPYRYTILPTFSRTPFFTVDHALPHHRRVLSNSTQQSCRYVQYVDKMFQTCVCVCWSEPSPSTHPPTNLPDLQCIPLLWPRAITSSVRYVMKGSSCSFCSDKFSCGI